MGIRGGNLGFIAGNTWRFRKYLYEQVEKKRENTFAGQDLDSIWENINRSMLNSHYSHKPNNHFVPLLYIHPWFTLRLALLMGFYAKNKKKYKDKFKDIRDYLPLMNDKKEEGTWSEFMKDFVKSHAGRLLSTPSAKDSLILLYLNRKYIIKKLLGRDSGQIEKLRSQRSVLNDKIFNIK